VKLVGDSHILIFYLFTPARLSETALEALGQAEDDEGIVVSAATLGDLWYASHKAGVGALAPGAFESLRQTVTGPETNFEIAAITAETMRYFGQVPLTELADPFDQVHLRHRGPARPSAGHHRPRHDRGKPRPHHPIGDAEFVDRRQRRRRDACMLSGGPTGGQDDEEGEGATRKSKIDALLYPWFSVRIDTKRRATSSPPGRSPRR
jgi:PIN domain nuclease of toxin-antitoxin system